MAVKTFPASDADVKTSAARRKGSAKKASQPPFVKFYLISYNLINWAAWASILFLLIKHVVDPSTEPTITSANAHTATAKFWVFINKVSASAIPTGKTLTSKELLLDRLRSSYTAVGPLVAFVQTAAALEVVHAAIGFVRSPVATTAAQVASRLWVVWACMEQSDQARTSVWYSACIFAWSVTETIRYPFYALGLVGLEPRFLLWLRYTTFYVLYPLGAGAEAWLSWVSLPSFTTLPVVGPIFAELLKNDGILSPFKVFFAQHATRSWETLDYCRGGLLFVWPPALYVMYTYMIKQRKKTLGGAPKVKKA